MYDYIGNFANPELVTEEINDEREFHRVTQIGKEYTTFSVFHNNIRSVSKNINEMNILLEKFDYSFDCIIFTETFNIEDLNFFNISGYNLIYNEGSLNRNDGVIMYLKDTHDYNIKILNIGNIKIIKANIHYLGKTIVVSAIYRSPSLCPYEFNNQLAQYLNISY